MTSRVTQPVSALPSLDSAQLDAELARHPAAERVIWLRTELLETRRQVVIEQANVQRLADELMLANQRIEQLAMTDALTSLPNRRYAIDRLGRALSVSMRYARPLSIILVDVFGTAEVNAAHGQAAGDAVIRACAAALRSEVRVSDDVARFDGDAFLVICHETSLGAAAVVAERLLIRINNLQVPLGADAWSGVAHAGLVDHGVRLNSAEAMLQAVTDAASVAKTRGQPLVTTTG